MPRLKHAVTGVVIDVSDETAEGIKGAWEPADEPAEKDPAPAKSARTKSE